MTDLQTLIWVGKGYLEAQDERRRNGPRWQAVKALYSSRTYEPEVVRARRARVILRGLAAWWAATPSGQGRRS
jgi:hypothetical protein